MLGGEKRSEGYAESLDSMGGNGKTYLVLAESRETMTVTRTRPVFRMIYCPHCGSDTNLFRRDDDEPEGSHALLCKHGEAKIGETTENAAANGDKIVKTIPRRFFDIG